MTITKEQIEQKAHDIRSWVGDAVGDMAANYKDFIWMDSKWKKRVENAKRNGVIDLKGWLADEYYSDPDMMQDMAGDRVHDACYELGVKEYSSPEFKQTFNAICDVLIVIGHNALKLAAQKLKRE